MVNTNMLKYKAQYTVLESSFDSNKNLNRWATFDNDGELVKL